MKLIRMDFNGTSPTFKSDLGDLLYRLRYKRMFFFTGIYRLNIYGRIHMDREKCSGCVLCCQVCPKGAYAFSSNLGKAVIIRGDECVNCGVQKMFDHLLAVSI
ncbi:MAG: hypothetical protein J7J22_06555 [Candidatus Verstraetearchaeota archaeon]|nr:hypothetical protein [Candidatus Verstraetearchaeota archaeon]